ncbi:MAG: HEAT repeat domain-containing protein [Pseudomonadota bacterium]
MTRSFFPVGVLSLGLLTAQVLSALFIYLSNVRIYASLTAVNYAGYLAVPNLRVMAGLREFAPAFYGGLFFTFTLGAGISLITMGSVWIWDRLFSRNKRLSLLFLLPWAGSIVGANWQGFNPMATSFFILVPAVVLPASLKWRTVQNDNGLLFSSMVFWIPFVLLLVLWLVKIDSQMLLSFRDNILMSNSIGIRINDFYYAHSLYPAEVLKSLDQKLIRTCDLDSVGDDPVKDALGKVLLSNDYIDVGNRAETDLKILVNGDVLIFENSGKTILGTQLKDFLSNPGPDLTKISVKSDRFVLFRHLTFLSLMIGLPIAAYIVLQATFCSISSCFLSSGISRVAASIICFAIGAVLLVPAFIEKEKIIPVKELSAVLGSEDWQDRVAALKVLLQNNMEIGDFTPGRKIMKSPHIPERYWLVRVLGISRKPETYKELLSFLDDLHPNVVCMAYRSLGLRQDRNAVGEIIKRLETSDDWYEQWYAYKALRALGWKQTKSN